MCGCVCVCVCVSVCVSVSVSVIRGLARFVFPFPPSSPYKQHHAAGALLSVHGVPPDGVSGEGGKILALG